MQQPQRNICTSGCSRRIAVQMVASGPEAQRYASEQSYALVVLDLHRNGLVGLDALRSIRWKKPDQQVLMVAGANIVEDRVRGLHAGADDFVAKPFEIAELAARIRAVVRRGNRTGCAALQVSDLQLDRITHGLQRQGRQIDLSPKEFSLLELLMRHAGQPVSRPAIVEQVWKLNCDTMTNVVDVYINYLRRKVDVGFELPLIRTVRGVGYQIGANVTAV
jgi:DNA-binding response OmpR family regulator